MMKKLLSIWLLAALSWGAIAFEAEARDRRVPIVAGGGGGGGVTLNTQCERSDQDAVSSTQCSAAFTVTTGHLIACVARYQKTAGSTSMSIADGTNTYTPLTATTYNDPDGQQQVFYVANATGGSMQPTATFGAAVRFPSLWCGDFTGVATSSPLVGQAAQRQASPGTGTDSVTTGNSGTLSAQPANVIGFIYNDTCSSTCTPGTGTGETSLATTWTFGGAVPASMRVVTKRVTSTSAVAATATAASGTGTDTFFNAMGVFSE